MATATSNTNQYFLVKYNGKTINDKAFNTLAGHAEINSKNGFGEARSVSFSAKVVGDTNNRNTRQIDPVRITFTDDATALLLLDYMNKGAALELTVVGTRINNTDNSAELKVIRRFVGNGKVVAVSNTIAAGKESEGVDYFEFAVKNYKWSVDDDLAGTKLEIEDKQTA